MLKQAIVTIPPCVLTLTSFMFAALCFTPFLKKDKALLWGGLELGFWLLASSATQAIGLQYTTANRSAFITTLYVVLVPLLLGLLGRSFRLPIWVAAVFAFAGVGILSYDRFPPNLGDFWTLGAALSLSLYILRTEVYASRFFTPSLVAAQLWAAFGFACLWVLLSEPQLLTTGQLFSDMPWTSVLYLGVVVTAGSIWVQTWGQARVTSTEAALIYTLEPVWGLVFAYLILDEVLGWQGFLGASLVVLATLISQFSSQYERKKHRSLYR